MSRRYPSWKESRAAEARAASRTREIGPSPVVAGGGIGKPARYPSWKEQQVEERETVASDARRQSRRQENLWKYASNARTRVASGEMSPVTGYALVTVSVGAAILDFVTGFVPGVSEIASFATTSAMTIIILLDPELRKQAVADRTKLILKRLLLNWTIGFLEGSLYFINLFPTEVIGAVITTRMRTKVSSNKRT